MTVAFVHYHLQKGGVTRVLETQSQALTDAAIPHVILGGTPYAGSEFLPFRVIPELNYSKETTPDRVMKLVAEMRSQAHQSLGAEPDIWHIHNHSLGKNALMVAAVHELSKTSKLLLQIHDFAEDGRPENYRLLTETKNNLHSLYPTGPHIHYAFINSRDLKLMRQAGLPKTISTLLPNSINPPVILSPPHRLQNPLVIYPVRGIRRKNLGEVCLLAAHAPVKARFAISASPNNQIWQPIHDRWEKFATDHQLPVQFGVVNTQSPPVPKASDSSPPPTFESWIAHATHCMTTSIAEGFGLTFLEPIAFGKPLFGRNLPEITKDFTENGLQLGDLYQRILIPRELIDLENLRQTLSQKIQHAYSCYDQVCTPKILTKALETIVQRRFLDFGNLPETHQESVLAAILSQPSLKKKIFAETSSGQIPLSDWLHESLSKDTPSDLMHQLEPYSLKQYKLRLTSLYKTLTQSAPNSASSLPEETVLRQFLLPERFHFLRI